MSQTGAGSVRNLSGNAPDANTIGQNQTWQNVGASRVGGTTYTNTTGRPICVAIIDGGDGVRELRVDGVVVGYTNGVGIDGSMFTIVPAGSTYLYTAGAPFSSWTELR